jgi:aminotransferase MxcL
MERYLAEMARRGVLLRRDVNFISAAHTEAQVDFTVRASDEALRQLEAAS